jgi:2-polyprenyl-6-hydroxyphenyl methylase/3-demethylubiquinone-9 3-methyltransferase
MSAFLRRFVASQIATCKSIDRRFFGALTTDGNGEFCRLVRELITPDAVVADIGGGKTPVFTVGEVAEHRLRVTGVDIDASELARAPAGAYAETVVSAIERCEGPQAHDFVLAQSVLEHVRDGRGAAAGIASLAKPGATIVTFCPCKRAWFARLNLALPEALKRAVLFGVFPEKRERQGFPAFYDGCSPAEMIQNMAAAGVSVREVRYFYVSSYFMFFVPLYLLWRVVNYPLIKMFPTRYCETFIFVGTRNR